MNPARQRFCAPEFHPAGAGKNSDVSGQQKSTDKCSNVAWGFAYSDNWPRFARTDTGLWRHCIGTWEILGDRLYLIGLEATMMDGTPGTLATIFPSFPDRVFAHWYSGELRVPRGKLMKYVHSGFRSKYEEDLFLDIANGVLTGTRLVKNESGG